MTIYDAADLKKRLVEATDFADFHDFFLTNFVERGRFMNMGRSLSQRRSLFLTEAFGEAYMKLHKLRMTIVSSRLMEVPELGLIHGTFDVDGKMASVLYFDDIAMGMFTIVDNVRTGKIDYLRFTAHRPTGSPPN